MSFIRRCQICGKEYISENPYGTPCSDECEEIMEQELEIYKKEIESAVLKIFLDSTPKALEAIGLSSIDEYPQWKLNQKQGCVYFVKQGNAVKIGFSRDVHKRVAALQTSSPEKLELIGYIPGTLDVESDLHRIFEKYRLKGEWFEYSQEIQLYLLENEYLITGEEQACQIETQAENFNQA